MILSINRTCQKSEFNRILLEKTTQRNPAFCEFAFLVSIVYARKHCILKEVGYHVNIDLFFLQWFGAWTLFTWSIYAPDIKRFCLTFHRATYVFIVSASLKKHYFFMIFVTLGMEGVPLGKRFKKGAEKLLHCAPPKWRFFVHRDTSGPLSKNVKF